MTRSEARTQKRKEVVEAIVLRNESATLVARVYNTSLRNVFNWLARYRSGGWQALNDKSKQGRPRKVTGDDMEWLYNAIPMGNPMNYQFSFCLWSLNIIRGLLEKERDIKLSKSSMSRLLNHLGLSPQKPLYKSYKQDPQQIKDYLSQTYPEAVAEAKSTMHDFTSLMKPPLEVTPTAGLLGERLGKHLLSKIQGVVLALN